MPQNIGSNSNRVPEPFEMIQVNHCKNPTCPNFGVPASTKVQPRGRHADPAKQDGYIRKNPKEGGGPQKLDSVLSSDSDPNGRIRDEQET